MVSFRVLVRKERRRWGIGVKSGRDSPRAAMGSYWGERSDAEMILWNHCKRARFDAKLHLTSLSS